MPVLILIACVLVIIQPWLSGRIAARRKRLAEQRRRASAGPASRTSPVLAAGMFASAAYGGYFGAAQGVLVIGLLGTFLDESMQRVNGAKNVLVAIVNGTAAIVYIIFAHVAWLAVLLIAVGSTAGGIVGARYGRRLPPGRAADLRRADRRHLRRQADLLLSLASSGLPARLRAQASAAAADRPWRGAPEQPGAGDDRARRAAAATANATRSEDRSATPPITLGAAIPAP